jgi:hypothetical protein
MKSNNEEDANLLSPKTAGDSCPGTSSTLIPKSRQGTGLSGEKQTLGSRRAWDAGGAGDNMARPLP